MNADALSQIVDATSATTVVWIAAFATLLAAMVGKIFGRRQHHVETRRGSGPYRHMLVVEQRFASVPPLVFAAALSCIAFGHVFPPIVVIALVRFPLDGMVASLAATVPIGLCCLACGWRMLWGAAPAGWLVRALFIMSGALFVLSAAHIGLALHPETDGVELATIGLVVALSACVLASLLLATGARGSAADRRRSSPACCAARRT